MVEMGSEKVADPEFTTLASGLLKDNDKLDANKHILLNMLKMHSM